MKFLLPQGIGDSIWAMHKIQSVSAKLGDGKIDAYLNCNEPSEVQSRALDFIRRFDFVNKSDMLIGASIHPDDCYIDQGGRYIYIPDGPTDFNGDTYYALMPNGHLERGNRLENWLPQFDINWDLMRHFRISENEQECGSFLKEKLGNYAVFYLGPLTGNLSQGHNRRALWSPQEWIDLGDRLHKEFGLDIVVVGAQYDDPYYALMIEPLLNGRKFWTNIIGRTNLGELYSATMSSRFVISYQSGVGIVSSYLKVPLGIFWRPKGNSISQEAFISFEEEMASAWTNPCMIKSGKHMPLIYGRHGVDYIVSQIKERGW